MSTLALVTRRRGFAVLRTRHRWLYLTCLAFVGLILLAGVFGPWLAPRDPNAADLGAALTGPSSVYPLGTDSSGRDVLSRLLVGARQSAAGALGVAVLSTLFGVIVGVVAGWKGGWLDSVLSRTSELLLAFPGLLLALLFHAIYGPGLLAPVIALSLAYTPYVSRLTRALTVAERERPYLASYRVQGFSGPAIVGKHLLPNIAPVVLAQSTLNFGYGLVDLAGLSFLGFGVPPLTPDWGSMVNGGMDGVQQGQPLSAFLPCLAIVLTVIAFNVVGQHWADRVARRDR